MEEELQKRNLDTDPITSPGQLDERLHQLMQAMHAIRAKKIPQTHPIPFTKRWWSKSLENARKEVGRLARQAWRERGDPQLLIHQQYRTARNRYQDKLQKAKRNTGMPSSKKSTANQYGTSAHTPRETPQMAAVLDAHTYRRLERLALPNTPPATAKKAKSYTAPSSYRKQSPSNYRPAFSTHRQSSKFRS